MRTPGPLGLAVHILPFLVDDDPSGTNEEEEGVQELMDLAFFNAPCPRCKVRDGTCFVSQVSGSEISRSEAVMRRNAAVEKWAAAGKNEETMSKLHAYRG